MQRKAFLTVFLALLAVVAISAQVAPDDEPLRIGTGLVSLSVRVTDRGGRAIPGLDKNAFSVFDNGRAQEISFFSADDVPASVSLVFDSSASMDGRKLDLARQAIARFIETSRPDDEYFLIDFNSKARILIDRSRDADAILEQLKSVQANGQTALLDAVELGVSRVEKGSRSKKIVLVISDGEDNRSRATMRGLSKRLTEADGVIYAIGFGGIMSRKGFLSGRDTLRELVATTGGAAYFPEDDVAVDEVFEEIARDIRNIYSLGFYPQGDDGIHQVRVEVRTGKPGNKPIVRTKRFANESLTE